MSSFALNYTDEQREILGRNLRRLILVACGGIPAQNAAEKRFLLVCMGREKPETAEEKAYLVWRHNADLAEEIHRGYCEDRFSCQDEVKFVKKQRPLEYASSADFFKETDDKDFDEDDEYESDDGFFEEDEDDDDRNERDDAYLKDDSDNDEPVYESESERYLYSIEEFVDDDSDYWLV